MHQDVYMNEQIILKPHFKQHNTLVKLLDSLVEETPWYIITVLSREDCCGASKDYSPNNGHTSVSAFSNWERDSERSAEHALKSMTR
jgi:hypothetical protein